MLDDIEATIETTLEQLEDAMDTLRSQRSLAARATADAKKAHARAILDAANHGCRNREERQAHADLASADLEAAAEIADRTYRDTLTAIRVLQARLDVLRSTMVTRRQINV